MRHLFDLHLWHLFKCLRITEVVSKMINSLLTCLTNSDLVPSMMMSKIRRRQYLTVNLMKTIKKIPCTFIQKMNRLWKGMNDLPSELYTIEPNNKIPDNCNRIKKQTNTGGFTELFKFKDWSKSNVNS